MNSVLDQWEEEASICPKDGKQENCDCWKSQENKRIKALIDLVRKKDEALRFISNYIQKNEYGVTISTREAIEAKNALALTEGLERSDSTQELK